MLFSFQPLRSALILLQKYVLGSQFDHIGVIVRQNDYPYLLECGFNGIQVMKMNCAVLYYNAPQSYELNNEELTKQVLLLWFCRSASSNG